MKETEQQDSKGQVLVIPPEKIESYWQPVPANGHIVVAIAPDHVKMDCPLAMGTQTLTPGGYVREHSHEHNEEILYFIEGEGTAVIDGERHRLIPGTTIFVGKRRRHMFINDRDALLRWAWVIAPNGLENFFRQVGRQRHPGEPTPVNFPRPANVLEIERNTVFAPQPADQRNP
jgi:mannose-6-phosphate isomerase-like protein (cupin superfamily)